MKTKKISSKDLINKFQSVLEYKDNRTVFKDEIMFDVMSENKEYSVISNTVNSENLGGDYGFMLNTIGSLLEYLQDEEFTIDTIEELELHEYIDSLIDIYNSDLLQWLSLNLTHASYVEESVTEFGIDEKNFSLYRLISQGQYKMIFDIYYELISNIKEYITDNNIEIVKA